MDERTSSHDDTSLASHCAVLDEILEKIFSHRERLAFADFTNRVEADCDCVGLRAIVDEVIGDGTNEGFEGVRRNEVVNASGGEGEDCWCLNLTRLQEAFEIVVERKHDDLMFGNDTGDDGEIQETNFETFACSLKLRKKFFGEGLRIAEKANRIDILFVVSSLFAEFGIELSFGTFDVALQDALAMASLGLGLVLVHGSCHGLGDRFGIQIFFIIVVVERGDFGELHQEEAEGGADDSGVFGEARLNKNFDALVVDPNSATVQIDHNEKSATSLSGIVLADDGEEEVLNGAVRLLGGLTTGDVVVDRLLVLCLSRGRSLVLSLLICLDFFRGHVETTNVADDVAKNVLSQVFVADQEEIEQDGKSFLRRNEAFGAKQHQVVDEVTTSVGIHLGASCAQRFDEDVRNVGAFFGIATSDVAQIVEDGSELRVFLRGLLLLLLRCHFSSVSRADVVILLCSVDISGSDQTLSCCCDFAESIEVTKLSHEFFIV